MTDTQLSSSAARPAPNQTVRASGRERIAVEITRAPERGGDAREVGNGERAQNSRESVSRVPDNQGQEVRIAREDVPVQPRPEEHRVRAHAESVSLEGRVVLPTPAGEFEVQITDVRAVQRLQTEIARRVVEVELVVPPTTPSNGAAAGSAVNVATEIVILPPSDTRPATADIPPRLSLDTPVQVQISDGSVAVQEALPPLDLTVRQGLPDTPFRLEAVAAVDVQPYLGSSSPPVEIIGQVVEVLPAATTVVVSPSVVQAVPIVSSVPDVPLVEVTSVSVPLSSSLAFSSPLSRAAFDVPPPVLAPQASVVTLPTLPAAENLITTLPAEGSVTVPLQSSYVRLDSVQALPSEIVPPLDVLAAAEGRAEALILNNVQAAVSTAKIVGQTPSNLPIVSLPDLAAGGEAFFVLHRPVSDLTVGTDLSFVPLSSSTAGEVGALVSSVQSPAVLSPAFFAPAPWSVLTDALQALQVSTPQVAQALSNITPSPAAPAQLTSAAMFFLAAVGAGDVSNWLGQRHMDALHRAGQSGKIDQFGREIQGLARASSDPVSQDWRAMVLPMLWDNEIHKAVIHYRHDGSFDEEGQDGDGKQTRFVFDLALDGMGEVQLDALFRPGRLDTILRTEARFSEVMHSEMRRMYTDGLKLSEMSGELSFQHEAEQWVKILHERQRASVRV